MGFFDFFKRKRKLTKQEKEEIKQLLDEYALSPEEIAEMERIEKETQAYLEHDAKVGELLDELFAKDKEYAEKHNVNDYIRYYTELWRTKPDLLEAKRWVFRLADLYVDIEQYDNAIKFCQNIKVVKPEFAEHADYHISNIEKAKKKAEKAKQ